MAYLFVHFKEKTTPDGEQIYFGVSKDGYNWENVNGGEVVLWAAKGERGVRDTSIFRANDGVFYMFSTDLCLARNFAAKYGGSWAGINTGGSKNLLMWRSRDLIHWEEEKEPALGDEGFGCLWAPEMVYDNESGDYILHWSASHASNGYGFKKIWYSRTRDFEHFSKPEVLCEKKDSGIIDSSYYYEGGKWYRFLKSEINPAMIILEEGDSLWGGFSRIEAFDEALSDLARGQYEAPTAYKLPDGKWCLMLDFYGCPKDEMGYIPFVADSLGSGNFVRADEMFSFPHMFKHGTVIEITDEEYDRVKNHIWQR